MEHARAQGDTTAGKKCRADQRPTAARANRVAFVGHLPPDLRWLRAPRHTVCSTVALTSCCSRQNLTLCRYTREPKPVRLSGMRSHLVKLSPAMARTRG